VKNVHLSKYEKLVKELHVYTITKLSVALNAQNYKPCRHEFRLYFQYKTEIKEIMESSIPIHGFSFTPFRSVHQIARENDFLIGKFLI
jgi:hypothetical protein